MTFINRIWGLKTLILPLVLALSYLIAIKELFPKP